MSAPPSRGATRVHAAAAAIPLDGQDEILAKPILPRAFFARPPEVVARRLLGMRLCRRESGMLRIGEIVECEAYLSRGDEACHAFRGRRAGNAAMFGPPGCAYVYPIHSRVCFNVVTEAEGIGSAVLIRALRPLVGLIAMRRSRGDVPERDLARGPARLCAAMGIDRALDGCVLSEASGVWIAGAPPVQDDQVARTVRIGVTRSCSQPLRFAIAGDRCVSGPRWLSAGSDAAHGRRRARGSAAAARG